MTNAHVTTYDPLAKTLHWGIAVAVLVMFVTAMLMGTTEDVISQETRQAIYTTHKSTGFLILCFMVVRILWFVRHPRPPLPVHLMPHWQVLAAHFVHTSLYVLGVVTPLIGWALVSLGSGLMLFGLIDIPSLPLASLAETYPDIRHMVHESHEVAATIFAGLIVVHIGATFLHHFVDRDDVFLRIMPECTHGWLRKIRGS